MNGYNIALLRLILCLNMLPESERVCPGICKYGLKKKDNKSIPFESNIANIDFTILPNLTTNPYTAVIKYHRFDSVENVIEKNNILRIYFHFIMASP